jgi:hypothetical protein
MPGLVPGIHVFGAVCKKDVDGRVKPGHDEAKNHISTSRHSTAIESPIASVSNCPNRISSASTPGTSATASAIVEGQVIGVSSSGYGAAVAHVPIASAFCRLVPDRDIPATIANDMTVEI